MSGTPTEAEIQTQWSNAVDVLETLRALVDDTLAGTGGKFDALLIDLEGEYLPSEMAAFVNVMRSGLSDLLSPGIASSVLTPVLFEYGNLLSKHATLGYGGGYRSISELFRALYEWFNDNTLTVESRAITYDSSATLGAGNVGDGTLSRLTEDENGYNLEACHVEKKTFRCRADQNSGTEENAEVFEFLGEASSFDSVLRAQFGSGESARTTIVSKHAGSGSGGSLLTNSSFSEYSATASPKFTAWTESAGGAGATQVTGASNIYRTHPGAQTDASLKLDGSLAATITLKQTVAQMRARRLDPDVPYFLRIMWNRSVGSGDGTLVIRMGSQSASVVLAAQSGWQELVMAADQTAWFRQFNEDPMDIEIELTSPSTGYVLVDDVIFTPYDLVDGTYWCLRGNDATPVPWLVDDTIQYTDTGGAPATGKIQWWLFVAGFGYLPSSGTPSFADP